MPAEQPNGESSQTGSEESAHLCACLNCLYTDAHNMGTKEEELEVCVQFLDYDLFVIMETWDSSQACHATTDRSKLFSKDRLARRGGKLSFM